MTKEKIPQTLDEDSLKELREWIETERDKEESKVPASILSILSFILIFLTTGNQFKSKREKVFHLWKQVWGIESKSESRKKLKSDNTDGKKKDESDEEREKRLAKEREKREAEKQKIEKTFQEGLENFWNGREKMKEIYKYMVFDENQWLNWRFKIVKSRRGMTVDLLLAYKANWDYAAEKVAPYSPPSGVFDDYEVKPPIENLFGSIPYSIVEKKNHRIPLGENPSPSRAIRTRVVKDFSFSFQEIEIEQEYFTDSTGGKEYAQETSPIAPPRFGYTFQSIINIMMLVVSFAIPVNRLATMLQGFPSGFSSSGIWNLLDYAAKRLCPIYLQLAKELNKCHYLRGDDTFPKVLELHEDEDEISEAKGVRKEVERFFPLLSKKKNGMVKERIQTSFLTGLTRKNDEASRILFYRTHRGSVGNLLDYVFSLRKKRPDDEKNSKSPPKDEFSKKIIMTSDLSKENLPREEILQELGIEFETAGCLAHARRGIFRNRRASPERCNKILQLFEEIYSVERYIKETFDDNTLFRVELRCRLSSRFWQMIVQEAQSLSDEWPDSEIKKAADYIIRNQEMIAKFLTNPILEPDNNFSERNVRPEKMFKNNRLFSRTVYGRVVFDILLTLVRTTIASGANPKDYFMWVFQAKPDNVQLNPEKYLPFAFVENSRKNHKPS